MSSHLTNRHTLKACCFSNFFSGDRRRISDYGVLKFYDSALKLSGVTVICSGGKPVSQSDFYGILPGYGNFCRRGGTE